MKWLCLLLITLAGKAFAQVPVNPNKSDASGKRQGLWTSLQDKKGAFTTIPDSAVYYRVATYKDDKPVGIVRDYYYKTRLIQFEGTMSEDLPKVLYDGKVTWYDENGKKEFEAIMKGEQLAGEYALYSEDGTLLTEPGDSLNSRGKTLYKSGQYKESIVYFKKAALRAKYEYGEFSVKRASMLANVALAYSKLNDYTTAGPYSLKALDIYKQVGETSTMNFVSMDVIAASYWQLQNEYDKAILLFGHAVMTTEKLQGKESNLYMSHYLNLATCIFKSDQYAAAKPYYQEIKYQFENVKENKIPPDAYVTAMLRLGTIYTKLRELKEGKQVYGELLVYVKGKKEYEKVEGMLPGIIEKLNTKIPKPVISQTGDRVTKGIQLRTAGDYEAAEIEFEAAVKTRIVKYGAEGEMTSWVYYYLGLNNTDLARYDKALQYFDKYSAIIEKTQSKNSSDYASGLSSKGVAYLKAGRISEAEPLIQEGYKIALPFRESKPKDFSIIAFNLSRFYIESRNFDKAKEIALEVLAIRKKAFGPDDLYYGEALNHLGTIYIQLDENKEAEKVLLEALAIFEKQLGKESGNYGVTQQNLSLVYQNLGEGKKSSDLAMEALLSKLGNFGPDHPEYAISLNALGVQAIFGRHYQDAKIFLLNAKQVTEKSVGKNHPNYVIILSNLALAYELSYEDKEAEKYYNECLSLMRAQLNKIFPLLSDVEKKKYYDNLVPVFQNYGNFVLGTSSYENGGKRIGDWYNLRMETKGLLFHSSTQLRQRIFNSGDPQLISKFKSWQQLRDSLAKSYQRPTPEINKNISKLEDQTNQLEKVMSQYSEAYRKNSENKIYSWKDVQKQLKPGEAAIELIRMEMRTKDDDDGSFSENPVYVALIIRYETKANPDVLVLPGADFMEKGHFRKYKNSIMYGVSDRVSFEIFWEPLSKNLPGIKKVFFSADGVYHLLNLGTLQIPDRLNAAGQQAYLQDEIDIEVVLSTKDMITGLKNPDPLQKVILFGFPNYNNSKVTTVPDADRSLQLAMPTTREMKADTSQRFFSGDNISELPGTKIEVENIQQLLKNKSVSFNAYLSDQASEAEIKKIQSPTVLHIATHGYFLADEKKSTKPVNTNGSISFTNPLMRSGLLFSGAKYAFQAEHPATSGEDGVLTSLEATGLRLDQTRLVVLSACETGLGVVSNGDGVYGLQRAFQLAGARAVLMSLWTVPDDATQELMTEFYSQWLQGNSLREALKKAQSKVRQKHPAPHDWGGFVLIGN